MRGEGGTVPARTVLAQEIRDRSLTFEEFVRYAERFARQHGEPGTLSVRHLQRLASGHRGDGSPIGPPRPATARLLERIFNRRIDELLSEPFNVAVTGSLPVPLVVAVAVVTNGDNVLVVNRRSNGQQRVGWQFPAGVVKPGLDADRVAIEETAAETGVHSEVLNRLGSRIHPATGVLCAYFLCRYLVGQVVNGDPAENIDVAWVSAREIGALIPVAQIFSPVLAALGCIAASGVQAL